MVGLNLNLSPVLSLDEIRKQYSETLKDVAEVKKWKYLIINHTGELEQTYFFRVLWEDIKGSFGKANHADKAAISFAVLQIVSKGVRGNFFEDRTNLDLIIKLAQRSGLLPQIDHFAVINQIQLIQQISQHIFKEPVNQSLPLNIDEIIRRFYNLHEKKITPLFSPELLRQTIKPVGIELKEFNDNQPIVVEKDPNTEEVQNEDEVESKLDGEIGITLQPKEEETNEQNKNFKWGIILTIITIASSILYGVANTNNPKVFKLADDHSEAVDFFKQICNYTLRNYVKNRTNGPIALKEYLDPKWEPFILFEQGNILCQADLDPSNCEGIVCDSIISENSTDRLIRNWEVIEAQLPVDTDPAIIEALEQKHYTLYPKLIGTGKFNFKSHMRCRPFELKLEKMEKKRKG